MTERQTLEELLLAAGEPLPNFAICACCKQSRLPFEIVDAADVVGLPEQACSTCLIDAVRETAFAVEQEAVSLLPPWETPEGLEAKACRDRMLDKWRWTVAPDSPLSAACQAEFLAYLRAWHRMTLDASSAAEFTPPALPALAYPEGE